MFLERQDGLLIIKHSIEKEYFNINTWILFYCMFFIIFAKPEEENLEVKWVIFHMFFNSKA